MAKPKLVGKRDDGIGRQRIATGVTDTRSKTMLQHIQRMASYSQFMNFNLLAAARKLPAGTLMENRGAFFGSILCTLNHVMVADILWLNRFKLHVANYTALEALASFPVPHALDQLLYDNLSDLSVARMKLDNLILEWVPQISQDDLSLGLRYKRVNGEENSRAFDGLLMHFFNHQTHHRGQVTTLFSQAGVDVGATDLLVLLPEIN